MAASILWLCLAWRGSGRPYHLCHLDELFLADIIGRPQLPTPRNLYRSLAYYSAHALRDVSISDITVVTEKPTTVGEINAAFRWCHRPFGAQRHSDEKKLSASYGDEAEAVKWPLTCGFVLTDAYRWCPNCTVAVLRS